jgi:hypothetical protein
MCRSPEYPLQFVDGPVDGMWYRSLRPDGGGHDIVGPDTVNPFTRDADGRRPSRRGTCHRCGWDDDLLRTPRGLRRTSGVLATPRWMCAECANDLRSTDGAPMCSGSFTCGSVERGRPRC